MGCGASKYAMKVADEPIQDEPANRSGEEESTKRRAEEEAKKQKAAEDEAPKKKAEEEALEEAAKKSAEQEATERRVTEEAKKHAEKEAAKKRAEEEEAAKMRAEEEGAERRAEEERKKQNATEEEAAKKVAEEDDKKRFEKVKKERSRLLDRLKEKEGHKLAGGIGPAGGEEGQVPLENELDLRTEVDELFKKLYPGAPYQDCKDTYFADLLERESLAVVKASYFHKCIKDGKPFQDRASIPQEYIFPGKEVVNLWAKYGARFLIIVSYSWLSQMHPDPECYHLRRLDRALKEIEAFNRDELRFRTILGEFGVILDFCSLWQKHEKEETRTNLQLEQFGESLSEINTPYGHTEVTAIKLAAVPPEERRTYEDRGWTLFESIVIDGKGPSLSLQEMFPHVGAFNVITLGSDYDPDTELATGFRFAIKYSKASRRPPLTPQRFGNEMEMRGARAKERGVRLFTSGKDQPFVLDKYEKAFQELVATEQMVFGNMNWGPEEMVCLVEVLRSCRALKTLNLYGNQMGELAAEKLAAGLSSLTALETLILYDNNIGDLGAQRLAAGLSNITSLTKLDIDGNNVGELGAEKISSALPYMVKSGWEWQRVCKEEDGIESQRKIRLTGRRMAGASRDPLSAFDS